MIIEVCVDCAAGLEAARAGGADRVELCAALPLGGLTPAPGLMALAARGPLPAMAMIRPRAGGFVFRPDDVAQMEADIAAARAAGLAGVVLGASLPDGRLDTGTLTRLVKVAEGMDLTLHRAFDLTPDLPDALETAIALGFCRVLTSGGAIRAEDGLVVLASLVAQARGRISVMPGSGVTPANARAFKALGVGEVHASCSVARDCAAPLVAMGFAPVTERQTDMATIRALRAAVD